MTLEDVITILDWVLKWLFGIGIGYAVQLIFQNIGNKNNSHNTYITNNYYGTKEPKE